MFLASGNLHLLVAKILLELVFLAQRQTYRFSIVLGHSSLGLLVLPSNNLGSKDLVML